MLFRCRQILTLYSMTGHDKNILYLNKRSAITHEIKNLHLNTYLKNMISDINNNLSKKHDINFTNNLICENNIQAIPEMMNF